ncbi:MAG: arsenate reductase ArsC, partial [Phenylobacterium sp.]|nr:arsenate reductase ArsC [Phenylobacterium sp.]
GVEDPAAATGSEAEVAAAFATAERRLRRRVESFLALPVEVLDGPDVRARLEAIGKDANP